MSWQNCPEPAAPTPAAALPSVEMEIVPRRRSIGAFEVGRVLPAPKRRLVGPFIFFDEMGPAVLPPGEGMDVRPHPHIGLATITYLFEGSILHRDSLGYVQLIKPGDVNWMTAGKGIVHSERSDPEIIKTEESLHGLQLWIALPKMHEEIAPAFTHHPAADLPILSRDGLDVRLIAGSLFGKTSPVNALSPLFYVDVTLSRGVTFTLPPTYSERAAYLVAGKVTVEGRSYEPGRMLVFTQGNDIHMTATEGARFVCIGGEPLDGPRHIWWNFVSSRPERIEAAKAHWRDNLFNATIPGDDEFIPLPESL